VANHLPNERVPWAQTAAFQHWKPPLVSVQSSFRMYCKQPNFNLYIWELTNLHTQYTRGQDRVIQRATQSHHPCRATSMEMFHSEWYNVIPDMIWSTAAPPWRCPAVHWLVISRTIAACPGNRCEEKKGSRKLYRVHIRAQISLYQINANKCTHIWLNHHFINTFRTPTCFNP
jgi:hypothetical protein